MEKRKESIAIPQQEQEEGQGCNSDKNEGRASRVTAKDRTVMAKKKEGSEGIKEKYQINFRIDCKPL